MSGVDVLAAIDGLLDLARHRLAMKRRDFDRKVAAGKEPHNTVKIKADRAEYLQEMGEEARAAVAELMDKADSALVLGFTDTAARELRTALARCRGGAA